MQAYCWSRENNNWCRCKLQIHRFGYINNKKWAINEIKVRKIFIEELVKEVISVITGE